MRDRGASKVAMDRIISEEMDIPGYIGARIDGHQFQVFFAIGQDPG
jgi:hypothetical protein